MLALPVWGNVRPRGVGRRQDDRLTRQKGGNGVKVSPFHSIKQNVHHDNNQCTEGNNIETEYRRSGTGGKPLCAHCARL